MATPTVGDDRETGPIYALLRGIVWIGQAAAWLIVPILILVLAGVSLSALKLGTLIDWDGDVFLFGPKLTLASLGDLQWHLFGAMLMLSLAGALVTDSHVRVDFLRAGFSQRTKDTIDLVGHIIFTLPFASTVAWHGYDFAARAHRLNEGSNYDGLYDRFIIKAVLPLGAALIAVAAVGLAAKLALKLIGPTTNTAANADKDGDQPDG